MRINVTNRDICLQLFDLICELIVNIGVDDMRAGDIDVFGFRSHRNKTVSEGCLVCYCQRLQGFFESAVSCMNEG